MIGLTYTRGVTQADALETAVSRVGGQYAAYNSATVRTADGSRLRISAAGITSARGALLIYFDPDFASNDAALATQGALFEIALDSSNFIRGFYDKPSGQFRLARIVGGAGNRVDLNAQFSAGQPMAVYFGWDASTIYVAFNGGAIIQNISSGTFAVPEYADIGYGPMLGQARLDAAYGAVALFARPLTAPEWYTLAGLRATRPPLYGDGGTGSAMQALYIGADTAVRSLPTTGAAYDLNGGPVVLRALAGAGPGPSIHRVVTTPFQSGAIYLDTLGAVRKITAVLALVSEEQPTAIWDLRRDLAASANPRLGLGVLMMGTRTRLYEIDAVMDTEGVPYDDLRGPHLQGATVPFMCPGADWRGVVVAEHSASVPQAGLAIPLTIPMTFSASLDEIAITNEGDVPVYPVVTITAGSNGATAPGIANATSGASFAMADSFAMAAGQVLVLDMAARTALLGGVNVMGSRDPETEMWALEPGANTVEATVATGSAEVVVRYAPQYIGV